MIGPRHLGYACTLLLCVEHEGDSQLRQQLQINLPNGEWDEAVG
jgi:hypothetical protein